MSVHRIGSSTLTTTNNSGKFRRKMQSAKKAATVAMAKEAKEQAIEVFHSDGNGLWDANAPSTVEWKGHDKVMQGRSNDGHGTLNQSIEVRDNDPLRGSKATGWFPDPHPDSKLTIAGLAWVHEENYPWMSQVADQPRHEAAVIQAGKDAFAKGLA